MKFVALLFSALALSAGAHAQHHHNYDHRRQVATTSTHSGSPLLSSPPASGTSTAPSLTSMPTGSSGSSSYTMTNSPPSSATSIPTGQNGVPPLSLISSGMHTGTSSPLASTYMPGATPPFPGAPPLPTTCTSLSCPLHRSSHTHTSVLVVVNVADWPAQDKVPGTGKLPSLSSFLGRKTECRHRFSRGAAVDAGTCGFRCPRLVTDGRRYVRGRPGGGGGVQDAWLVDVWRVHA
jgi:hypothetical protein